MFLFSDWPGLFSSSPKALYESQQRQRANLVYRSGRTFQVIINSQICYGQRKKIVIFKLDKKITVTITIKTIVRVISITCSH